MLQLEKRHTLNALLDTATQEELVWINGYISGVLSGINKVQPAAKPSVKKKLSLLYGTETGNAKSLALKLTGIARKAGWEIKAGALEQYRPADLVREKQLLILISTQGDGEPPEAAKPFYDYIHRESLNLDGTTYGIIALGDSSYPFFCQAGKDIDQRLAALGASRLLETVTCDTDYEAEALQWFERFREKLDGQLESLAEAVPGLADIGVEKTRGSATGVGTIRRTINLNDRGSGKHTQHIEIATEGLAYLPGDALAITPSNPESLVAEVLDRVKYSGQEKVLYRAKEYELSDLLRNHLNIARLSERTVKAYADIVRQEIPPGKISLIDLLKIYPAPEEKQFLDVLQILEHQVPRQYSIASAPALHEDELHLTVALDTYTVNGEEKHGLCSDYLVHLQEGQQLSFKVHPNPRFRPAPLDTDMIMIGPGTGIAPFRAFLQAREEAGAAGRHWLFFGDRCFSSDFLYQTEIQQWIETGLLQRFNAAFSRDQAEKIYVQHRMEQQGSALWDWIENGAWLYVCGTKAPMSLDVEASLLRIIAEQGGKSAEEAALYLEEMSASGRYLKDVY